MGWHVLMTISSRTGSAHGTLRLADGVAGTSAQELTRTLDDALIAGCTRLKVDGRQVRHIEWPSLVALSAVKARLEAGGGSLVVTRASSAFRQAALRGGFPELTARPAAGLAADPVVEIERSP